MISSPLLSRTSRLLTWLCLSFFFVYLQHHRCQIMSSKFFTWPVIIIFKLFSVIQHIPATSIYYIMLVTHYNLKVRACPNRLRLGYLLHCWRVFRTSEEGPLGVQAKYHQQGRDAQFEGSVRVCYQVLIGLNNTQNIKNVYSMKNSELLAIIITLSHFEFYKRICKNTRRTIIIVGTALSGRIKGP